MRIERLDTPALIVDLEGLEDNLDRYPALISTNTGSVYAPI